MGFLTSIFGGNSESHEQGENWAERTFESGDTLTPEEVAALAQEYGKDPQAFYDGYRGKWNDYASIVNALRNDK